MNGTMTWYPGALVLFNNAPPYTFTPCITNINTNPQKMLAYITNKLKYYSAYEMQSCV